MWLWSLRSVLSKWGRMATESLDPLAFCWWWMLHAVRWQHACCESIGMIHACMLHEASCCRCGRCGLQPAVHVLHILPPALSHPSRCQQQACMQQHSTTAVLCHDCVMTTASSRPGGNASMQSPCTSSDGASCADFVQHACFSDTCSRIYPHISCPPCRCLDHHAAATPQLSLSLDLASSSCSSGPSTCYSSMRRSHW
jgi:hypothetical protein